MARLNSLLQPPDTSSHLERRDVTVKTQLDRQQHFVWSKIQRIKRPHTLDRGIRFNYLPHGLQRLFIKPLTDKQALALIDHQHRDPAQQHADNHRRHTIEIRQSELLSQKDPDERKQEPRSEEHTSELQSRF